MGQTSRVSESTEEVQVAFCAGKDECLKSGGAYENASFLARAGLGSNDDFDIAVQRGEEMHQPFHGKAVQAVIGKGGNLGLIDFQATGRRYLGKFLASDDLIDRHGEPGFRLFFLRVRQTQVGENIA
jgi:hypothetical protein